MTEKQWKGAIFDLDGTLLDSMGVWDQVDIDFLKKRNLPMPDDYKQKIAAMGFPEAARYTIERFGFSETPEMLLQEWREMAREAYALHVDLKPGAKDYLEKLKSQGIPIAAATSGDRELFIPCLKHDDIYEYFDAIVTVSEVKRGKGFPDIYERAAELIGVAPAECMVFEDLTAGVKGALDGGFQAMGILDDSSKKEWESIRKMATCTIRDFRELL